MATAAASWSKPWRTSTAVAATQVRATVCTRSRSSPSGSRYRVWNCSTSGAPWS